jgi:hypothetical protein
MDSNDRMLEEIRKYCDPYSILAVTGKRLIRIRCPFRAMAIVDYAGWKLGEIVSVEKIMVTRDLMMVYIINGKGYHFFFFRILLY